ncbi:hypothetical protein [Brevibacillus formosus]|uniref:hypothetical protein n=1 Tax=Brevibacillus formosus TaxID=54913 RepID=UPI003F1B43F6
MNHDWNSRLLEVLERTYNYDADMTELLLSETAKQYTTPQEQNENYRARLTQFKADIKEATV